MKKLILLLVLCLPLSASAWNVAMMGGRSPIILLNATLESCPACTADDGNNDDFSDAIEGDTDAGAVDWTATEHSGTYGVRILNTTGYDPPEIAWSWITVVPGTAYTAQFWTRGDGTYGGKWKVYDLTNSAWIVTATNTSITGTSYTLYTTAPFVAPAGCVLMGFYLEGNNANGSIVYFDDLTISY